MRLRFTILLLLFGCVCPGLGQQVSFIKYTVQEGLVANPVRCIYQDSKGFIWIGTFDGLSRYDGYKFTNYTTVNGLSHNFINSFFEVDGKVLIAENNGAIDVVENNTPHAKYRLGSAANIISTSNGRLLVSTDAHGFFEYRSDTLVAPPQPKFTSPYGHFVTINDSLILADGGDEIFLLSQGFVIKDSILNLPLHYFSLVQDSKKRIWACTSGGLKLVNVSQGIDPRISFVPLPAAFDVDVIKSGQVTSMIEEADGSFWIGTYKGLVHLSPDGHFYLYNEKDGLPTSRVQCLSLDKEKNLWIGTALGLVKLVSKNNVVFYNSEMEVFRNDVAGISALGDQRFILTTGHGLQNFDFNSKEFTDIKIPGNHYPVPITGTSPLLIHYADQIATLNQERNRVVTISRLDTTITGVILAQGHPDGTIFLATFKGLFVINKTSVTQIMPHRITCLALDINNNLWAGTWAEGLYRISKKDSEKQLYEVADMTRLTKEKEIRGLYFDSNSNIWVGTRYGGAFRFKPKAGSQYDVQHFSRQDGLMSDWVINFAETKTNDIWICTYLGIDKLVKEASGYRVFNFSKVVNFFAEIKKMVLSNDHWICVANTGIAIFKDENLHHTAPLQPVIFSSTLGIRENRITIYSPVDKVTLKPFQNAARFEFGALGFINEKQLLYSYRLKGGNDSVWSKPENIHEATYASLSPGEYSFEVKSMGWNGEYSIPASFSFHIATPFWKQWWFIALVIVGIVVLLYAFYRYRINQLLRLQTVRNSIATDLHDDIGSSLTNISILSELSSKNIADPEKAQPFLQRISEEVQTSSQAMDDIIWSVNSRNDSLQETMARMRRYAAELFDNSDIDCHLQLEENAGDKKLSMEQRRDVYLIYKEALNNIHKHAGASNVWVDVAQNHNYLFIKISDDGKGFNTSAVTHRNGLKNLQSRVEKWSGKIQIGSEAGKGTKIDIKIPLKE